MYEFAIQCKIKNGIPFIAFKYSNYHDMIDFLPFYIKDKKRYGVVIENENLNYLGDKFGDYHLTLLKRFVNDYEKI